MYVSYVIRTPASNPEYLNEKLLEHLVKVYKPSKLSLGQHMNTQRNHWHVHMLSPHSEDDPKFGKNRSRIVKGFKEDIVSKVQHKVLMVDEDAFMSYPLKEYTDNPGHVCWTPMRTRRILPDFVLNNCIGYDPLKINQMRSNANYAYNIATRMASQKEERMNKYSAAVADVYEHLDASCNIQTKPPKIEDFKHESEFIAAVALWNQSPNYKKLYHVIGIEVCQYYLNKQEVPPDKTADLVLQYMIIKKLLKADQLWQIKNKYKVNI